MLAETLWFDLSTEFLFNNQMLTEFWLRWYGTIWKQVVITRVDIRFSRIDLVSFWLDNLRFDWDEISWYSFDTTRYDWSKMIKR